MKNILIFIDSLLSKNIPYLKLRKESDTMFWISAGHTIAAGICQVRKVRAPQGRMPDNVRQG